MQGPLIVTKCHTKAESLINDTRVRLVIQNHESARYLAGAIFNELHHQVHKLPGFIKELTGEQVAKKVGHMMDKYKYCFGADYSAYDSSQGLRHHEFELCYIRRALGETAADIWHDLILGN